MLAEANVRADNDIGSDVRPVADLRSCVDDSSRVNARIVSRRLVKKPEGAREGQIGILDAQRRRRNLLKLGLDQHRGSLRLARQSGVLGVGHEGDLSGSSLLNPFNTSYFQLRVSA